MDEQVYLFDIILFEYVQFPMCTLESWCLSGSFCLPPRHKDTNLPAGRQGNHQESKEC